MSDPALKDACITVENTICDVRDILVVIGLALGIETSAMDKEELFTLAHVASLAEIAVKEAVEQAKLATVLASGKAP